jgi:AcrR family transcriptional regulator
VTVTAVPAPPAPGTRPRNRRDITIKVASDLFSTEGYSQVAMGDIARRINVGASAIYRHFSGKSELLVEAINLGISAYDEALTPASTDDADRPALSEIVRSVAACAVGNRAIGALWQKEARHLDDDGQRRVREGLRATVGKLAKFIADARPELSPDDADLLAWCSIGIFVSIGFHAISMPDEAMADLLAEMVLRVTAFTPVHAETATIGATAKSGDAEPSRRETLVVEATALFASRGFAGAGMDEIAQAAGIAGPSVYTHFTSKEELLAAAIQRSIEMLHVDSERIVRGGPPAEAQLSHLVDAYVGLANRDRSVIRIILSEMDRLTPADRELARGQLRDYIRLWAELLREATGADPIEARIRVHAVLLMVNDAVQTHHLQMRPGFEHELSALSRAVLEIS